MRKMFPLLVLIAMSQLTSAQFCCTKVGTMLFYNKHDSSKGVTNVDSVKVADVNDSDDALRVIYYSFTPDSKQTYSATTKCFDCELFVFDKKTQITAHYYMSENLFKEAMMKQSSQRASSKNVSQENETDKEFDPVFKIKGDLMIPLSNKFTTDTPIENSKFNYKIGFLKMNMGISKAKYLGVETIQTPAGTFRCQKISYQTNARVMLISGKANLTEWYAEGIGLVKREERNTRGKLQECFELIEIRH